ncbi:MAG: YggS family pyridoxal phosphate enzyme [Ignavibacteria bacterium GWB2_35_12]|nr:MAG: YggS family pyridoxal phosphate enzyme [Ignavibacteria bacterium GWB2_35_12]OGU96279.1 MAG: YggS family pyridoxal phosphate enzyme [Ignavibacteria bacterium RIFOXYA2_FULL_35_10]OGV20700.1 MAG: YggS family pyridoxal phosphate enzyme [Ignavibacteria bacterium RIFOXYC2_FULL_35_21]
MNNRTDDIKQNFEQIKIRVKDAAMKCGRNPNEITIVAVTKTHPTDIVKSGIDAGITVFGENYAQELKEKYDLLGNDAENIEWHFIGHLQTNKVKFIAPFVSLIHSVDSLHLAEEISRQAIKNNRTIEILLQVNTSGEESKSGCEPEDIFTLAKDVIQIPNLNVTGLMTIGSFTDDVVQIRKEFRMLRSIRDELNNIYGLNQFKHLSMGMTGDFEIAIEEGSTFIRVGTAIFGQRY